MSRSKKHTPIHGHTTSTSEKEDKQRANRAYRHKVNVALKQEDEVLPELKEVSDVWDFAKDGKQYDPNTDLRK